MPSSYPLDGEFKLLTNLEYCKSGHDLVVIDNDNIAIVGGSRRRNLYDGEPSSVDVYTISKRKWKSYTLGEQITDAPALVINNYMYIVGGERSFVGRGRLPRYLSCIQAINMKEKFRLEYTIKMPSPRSGSAAATIDNNSICIIGGFNGNHYLSLFDMYDTLTGLWYVFPQMPTPRSNLSVAVFMNHIIAAGGTNYSFNILTFASEANLPNKCLDVVEIFNLDTWTWKKIKPLDVPMMNFGIAKLLSGRKHVKFAYSDGRDIVYYSFNLDKWTCTQKNVIFKQKSRELSHCKMIFFDGAIVRCNEMSLSFSSVDYASAIYDLVRYAVQLSILV